MRYPAAGQLSHLPNMIARLARSSGWALVVASSQAYSMNTPLVAHRAGLRTRAPLMADDDFSGVKPSTVFMFPGQGAQTVGMGVEVAAEVPAAAELYAKASDILGYDLLAKCQGDKAELDKTEISQPAIFVSSLAAVEKLRASEGGAEAIEAANMAMGLSLGEYTALAFAGAISFEDGVKITKARGEAMQAASEAASSGMASVIGLDSEKVAELCAAASEASGETVTIANYLCPGNYACSGSMAAVDKVCEMAKPEVSAGTSVDCSTNDDSVGRLGSPLASLRTRMLPSPVRPWPVHLPHAWPCTLSRCPTAVQGPYGRQARRRRSLPHGLHGTGCRSSGGGSPLTHTRPATCLHTLSQLRARTRSASPTHSHICLQNDLRSLGRAHTRLHTREHARTISHNLARSRTCSHCCGGKLSVRWMDAPMQVLKEVEVAKPRIPVISNVDAKAHSDPAVIKDILTKQVRTPHEWRGEDCVWRCALL